MVNNDEYDNHINDEGAEYQGEEFKGNDEGDEFSDPESSIDGEIYLELDSFVFGRGPKDITSVPRISHVSVVKQYLDEKISPQLEAVSFWRIRHIMDFYYLKELLDGIKSFLRRNEENEEQYNRSICCTTILGEVGEDEQRAFGREYFTYLVSHQFAPTAFKSLLVCYAAHTPDLGAKILADRMEEHLNLLEPRTESEFDLGLEYREIDALMRNDFYQAQQASEVEAIILEMQEEGKYLNELVNIYLEIADYEGEEYLIPWAARKLRQAAHNKGAKDVIAAFRRIEKDLLAHKMDEEELNFVRTRTYRAIRFFGGEIGEEEEDHLRNYGGDQSDLLSNGEDTI